MKQEKNLIGNVPIAEWSVPTEILYADGDAMISRETVEAFAGKNQCSLTVMENG